MDEKIMIGFYGDGDLKRMLEQLAAHNDRTQASYLRTLIRREFAATFGAPALEPGKEIAVNPCTATV